MALTGILLTYQLFYLLLSYSRIPPVVPFFYSLTKGENQLAGKNFLFILPLASMIFFFTHIYLAKTNYSLDRFFARTITVSSTIVTLLITIALAHIIIITT